MKRNLLFLIVMVGALLFSTNQSWAAECSEDPIDLGICDTLYVETFDCDHTYDTLGSYDSVRVAIYVTHDSNTFWWDDYGQWVQDSITGIVVPLKWSKVGCADSVVFPSGYTTGPRAYWNNKKADRSAQWNRSIFRDITDTHTGKVDSNRYTYMISDLGWDPWQVNVSFKADSAMISMIAPGIGKWWEGQKVLLATLTFLVYLTYPPCSTTAICLDSTFWPPGSNLAFTRFDSRNYVPRHFLPTCDTLYTGVRWIEGSTEEETKPTVFSMSQNYPNPFNPYTNFKFSLPQASHVKIEIFNILGQRVKTLLDEDMKAGVFAVDWDAKDEKGVEVSSGIYFYRITAGDFSDIRKMVLMK